MIDLPKRPASLLDPRELKGWRVWEVLPAALRSLGAEFPSATSLSFPAAKRVCYVLIDGMGWENLTEALGHTRWLRAREREGAISQGWTCLPSTTSAAITSATTGLTPGESGVVAYTLRDPVSGKPVKMLTFDGASFTPEEIQPHPTLFERAGQAGLRSAALGPAKFVDKGLTRMALRGADFLVREQLDDRIEGAVEAFAAGYDCVYFYWGYLDSHGHREGLFSPEWVAEIEKVDRALETLSRRLPAGTLITVVADHGMIASHPDRKLDLRGLPWLEALVDGFSGEPRAIQLHLKDPQDAAGLERIRDFFADKAWVLDREQMAAVMGGVERSERLGDVNLLFAEDWQLFDSQFHSPRAIALKGVHGSLAAKELKIPLLAQVL